MTSRSRSLITRALPVLLCGSWLFATPASAGELAVTVQIPQLNVAEYHRPYVAVWLEQEDQTLVSHLSVWYMVKKGNEDGTQWLPDLRQWWRRGGRDLAVPVDGLTGATRPVGTHRLTFKSDSKQLAGVAPGKYNVVVEAVREVGGRELVRVPIEWPGQQKQQGSAQGKTELGAVTVEVTP